jgi:hypothetical protein
MKKSEIEIKGGKVKIVTQADGEDYISLTDIVSGFEDGNDLIKNWLRSRATVDFLGVWERFYNKDFNWVEFDLIRAEAGSNAFRLSVQKWSEKTGATGMRASSGRYGGTWAHRDIAIHFCTWLSPEYYLLLVREFQRLKEQESSVHNLEWKIRRELSKVNYSLQTHYVKTAIIERWQVKPSEEFLHYASEADLLNLALFGITAAQWRAANPEEALKNNNLRDMASLHELTVLSNLESYNSILLRNGLPKDSRFSELQRTAKQQLEIFENMSKFPVGKLSAKKRELKGGDDSFNPS